MFKRLTPDLFHSSLFLPGPAGTGVLTASETFSAAKRSGAQISGVNWQPGASL